MFSTMYIQYVLIHGHGEFCVEVRKLDGVRGRGCCPLLPEALTLGY